MTLTGTYNKLTTKSERAPKSDTWDSIILIYLTLKILLASGEWFFIYLTRTNIFFHRKIGGCTYNFIFNMSKWIPGSHKSISKVQKNSLTVLQFRNVQHEIPDSSPHFFFFLPKIKHSHSLLILTFYSSVTLLTKFIFSAAVWRTPTFPSALLILCVIRAECLEVEVIDLQKEKLFWEHLIVYTA